MKQIIDDYSPILEGVSEEELKQKVLGKAKNKSQKNSLHLDNTANGKDVPVTE